MRKRLKSFLCLASLTCILWGCPDTEPEIALPASTSSQKSIAHRPCEHTPPLCPPPFSCQQDATCLHGNQAWIPPGSYPVGCDDDDANLCMPQARPARRVQSQGFVMDLYEVTVADYAQCVESGECTAPSCSHQQDHPIKIRCNWQQNNRQNHPINGVTHGQAQAYCAHRNMRLPTDTEWEIAVRGAEGRLFAWGDEPIGAKGQSMANIADRHGRIRWGWPSIEGVDDGWAATAPVGSYPKGKSPFGIMDLVGNVWEWTAAQKGHKNVRIRGAGYANHGFYLRASSWDEKPPSTAEPYLGFRCARSVDQAAP